MTSMKLELVEILNIKPIPPYSLKWTVRKLTRFGIDWYWITPFEVFRDRIAWAASSLGDGDEVMGLKVFPINDARQQTIKAEIYLAPSYSMKEKKTAEQLVEKCLNPNDDVSEFCRIGEKYTYLRKAISQMCGTT